MFARVGAPVAAWLLLLASCGGGDTVGHLSVPSTPAATAPPTAVSSPTDATTSDSTEGTSRSAPAPWVLITGEVRTHGEQALPGAGTVVIMWVVSWGVDDYLFAFGKGTRQGDEFTVRLDGSPPAEALNQAVLGVGLLLLVPESANVPDGQMDGEAFENGDVEATGAAGDYAIIYRVDGDTGLAWVDQFPLGYSCGQGVDAVTSQDFDTFERVDCSMLVLDIGDLESIDFVNWT